ncbi:MAG: molybdate ABC transporter substrate-binding protein [Spirochaetaceae bacterium]|nr:molybdate ABC transporter substrate-binding protein [Spirochaetaceae bacterium]
MKHIKELLTFVIITIILFSCSTKHKDNFITILTAASTTDIISDIAALYEKDTGTKVKINTASSGTLAKQLETGAEADIFISASGKWMDYAESLGLIEERQPFLRNSLVLISHRDSPIASFEMNRNTNFPALFTSRLSMGDPDYVPAGQYALEALKYLGWYNSLKDRLLPAAHVRAALSVIEFDEAELGIVYETDSLKSHKVKIISFFPEESYSPILYHCALIQQSNTRGRIFYNYLTSSRQVEELYGKYGFSLPGS